VAFDSRPLAGLDGQPHPPAPPDHEPSFLAATSLAADPAVADVDDPVGKFGRALVVAHDDECGAVTGRELGEQAVYGRRGHGVELAGRLVREEDSRAMRECRTGGNALLLAPREPVGSVACPLLEPDPCKQLERTHTSLACGGAREQKGQLDVFGRGQRW